MKITKYAKAPAFTNRITTTTDTMVIVVLEPEESPSATVVLVPFEVGVRLSCFSSLLISNISSVGSTLYLSSDDGLARLLLFLFEVESEVVVV